MAEEKTTKGLACKDFEEAKETIARVPTTPGALRRAGVFLLDKITKMKKKYVEIWNELEQAHQDLTAREADIARLKEMLIEERAKIIVHNLRTGFKYPQKDMTAREIAKEQIEKELGEKK